MQPGGHARNLGQLAPRPVDADQDVLGDVIGRGGILDAADNEVPQQAGGGRPRLIDTALEVIRRPRWRSRLGSQRHPSLAPTDEPGPKWTHRRTPQFGFASFAPPCLRIQPALGRTVADIIREVGADRRVVVAALRRHNVTVTPRNTVARIASEPSTTLPTRPRGRQR